MTPRDVYQTIGSLDPDSRRAIVDRLEFRGRDPVFVAMRDAYLARIDLPSAASVLDLGCGTGVVTRALAARGDLTAALVGVDASADLISAGQSLAASEGHADRISLRQGDCHALGEADNTHDVVIAHTLVSHVVDPGAVIAEAARVTRPGGVVAVFDGDYASITFGAGDQARNAAVVDRILQTVVANPFVMRTLPDLLHRHGLTLTHFLPDVLAEAPVGSFFLSMADSYLPMVVRAGLMEESAAAQWVEAQHAASAEGAFFGACNYYGFIARKT